MDNPDDEPPKPPRKTLAERRKEAKKAVPLTKQLMEEEALQRERDMELQLERDRLIEEEEQQLQQKAAKEQHDLEVAMAMSSVPTPTENPLLMPRVQQDACTIKTQPTTTTDQEDGSMEHETASRQISYLLDCAGCEGKFEGTRKLKSHVKEKPECFTFWGGDFKSLEKKVKAEFQKRKRKLFTPEEKEAERSRKYFAYWADPQKERDRKNYAYENNKEFERERQSVIRATREETRTTTSDLSTFEKEGRYGPIFPCVSCQQLNWYTAVSIEDLETLPVDFVDIHHVNENISLFQKQNRFFLCRPCKKDLEEGKCPKMSSKNYLQCPWLDVPPHLLGLNLVNFDSILFNFKPIFLSQVENSLVARVVLFANLHNSMSGSIFQSKKITAVPVTEDFQSQVMKSATVESMMAKIIRGNNFNRPVYEGDVRTEVLRGVYQYLSSLGNTEGLRKVPDTDIVDYSIRQNPPDNLEELHTVHDVVLPENVFAPGQDNVPLWFLQVPSPYAKTMPVFFPRQTGDWDDPRRDPTRPISETEWIGHVLRSVHKQLTEFPLFPFTAAYRLDMKAIQSAFNNCTGFKLESDGTWKRSDVDGQRFVGTVTGSSEYYAKHKSNIKAKCNILGYPTLFVTLTNSEHWDVTLSTALSQDGWNIWHKNDEQRLLYPLEGLMHPIEDEGDYFAHVKTDRLREDDCPYHVDCKRSPIQTLLNDEAKKRLLSRNIYNIQRIFCQRTGSLLRNVVMSTSNGINGVSYHFLKEFGYERGLAHSHGLLWQRESEGQRVILKMQEGMILDETEINDVCSLVDGTVTASLDAGQLTNSFPDIEGERSENIVELAKQVQTHCCNKKCLMANDSDGCLYKFPRLPTEQTIICSPIGSSMEGSAAWYLESQCRKVKVSARAVLKQLKETDELHNTSLAEVLLEVLGQVDDQGPDEEGRYPFKDGGLFPPCTRLARWIRIMQESGHPYPVLFAIYYTALSTATWHVEGELVYQIFLKRSVCETYTVDYSPYLLECMKSNMEVRYVTHTPNLLINYVTKAENKPNIEKVIKDIQTTGGTITGAAVATRAQDYRKVSLEEAFFRIDTRLFFSNTNLQVVYVNTNFPSKRGRMFRRSSEGHINLPGRNGSFELLESTLVQYAKRYVVLCITRLCVGFFVGHWSPWV